MKEFLNSIDLFLEKKITYDEFERKICDYYEKDEIEFDRLTDIHATFVSDVYEKTTYTGKNVAQNDKDRKYGVIDESDFLSWLKQMKENNITLWLYNP